MRVGIAVTLGAASWWCLTALAAVRARARFGGRAVTILSRGMAYRERPAWPLAAQTQGLDAVTAATAALRVSSPSVYRERTASHTLQLTYPSNRALFPPNLCAPFVEWEDRQNDLWQVRIAVPGTKHEWRSLTQTRRWRVPRRIWRVLRTEATTRDAEIQVLGIRQSNRSRPVHATPSIRIRVSQDAADPYVVYRLVVPPFGRRKAPDTFIRPLDSDEASPFLLGRGKYCFNCHMFGSESGKIRRLSIQCRHMVRDDVLLDVYLGVWDFAEGYGRRIKLPFEIQMTTFMSWSPDATRLAISANQQLTTLPPVTYETQHVRLPTSDIAIHDLSTETASLLPGASDPKRLEAFPCWAPDGKALVFASAEKSEARTRTKFGLFSVPFNAGRGGEATPIAGATQEGKSHYFPRFSPDGRWLSFCRSDGGTLIKSSSDIHLLPATLKGQARNLESNVPYAADSWHSWSSNGHWLVFASKRDNGIFAQLYFTHIDDRGHASPAIRLPVADPPLASYNIPEFVPDRPRVSESALYGALRVDRPFVTVKSGDGR